MRTKLNTNQRDTLKAYKTYAKRDGVRVFHFPSTGNGATVAIKRTGDHMGEFSVSLASVDETKFSKKVGKYYALNRFYTDAVLPIRLAPRGEHWSHTEDEALIYAAESIARALT